MWSRLANKVIRGELTPGILDTQCGFKLFTAEAAVAVFSLTVTDGWSFDLEVLGRARRLGYRIDEVAVTWTDDPRSKISPLRDAIAVTREFLRIRRLLDGGRPGLKDAQPALGRSGILSTNSHPGACHEASRSARRQQLRWRGAGRG